MSKKPVDTNKYAGSGRLASAVGESALYSTGGTIAGVTGGTIAGAAIIRENGKLASEISVGAAKFWRSARSVLAEKSGVPLQELAVPKGAFRGTGKVMLITGIAAASAVVLSTIGGLFGLGLGVHKASKAKDQFNQLKAERDQAVGTIDQIQAAAMAQAMPEGGRRFTDSITSRAAQGSHAAAEANRASQTAIGRG